MAAILAKNLACNKNNTSRHDKTGRREGIGGTGEDHLIVGAGPGSGDRQYHYRSLVRFQFGGAWGDVDQVLSAFIVLEQDTSTGSNHFEPGASPRVEVRRVKNKETWSEGSNGEDHWDSGDYEWPDPDPNVGSRTSFKKADTASVALDVTSIINYILPEGVKGPTGSMGGGHDNLGFVLLADDETNHAQSAIFRSRNAPSPTTRARPYLRITYVAKNRKPDAPTSLTPNGDTSRAASFEGVHSDPDLSPMSGYQIVVYEKAGGKQVWPPTGTTLTRPASAQETNSGRFSVPLTVAGASLKSLTPYEWTAATVDDKGLVGTVSGRTALLITSSGPTAIAVSPPSAVTTLSGVGLGGTYSDPDGDTDDPLGYPMSGRRIQLRGQTAVGDPTWDTSTPLWDSGLVPITATERAARTVAADYEGPPLTAGTYSFRFLVADPAGNQSPWSYGTVVLSDVYVPDPGSDNYDFTTIVNLNAPMRVGIWSVGTKRGPGALIGYVEDPINLGSSSYLNGAGEAYFTLPALHPLASFIEPRGCHYTVEQWWGDRYRRLFAGLITDFDATPDEVVYYGTDYLGLLQTATDERFDPKLPDKLYNKGGSYYVNLSIDQIIHDELNYQIGLANSSVGFLSLPAVSSAGFSAMVEKATIYATYAQALPFVVGLMDSHKGGTGIETRLYVREKTSPTGDVPSTYEIAMIDRWGKDRPNIELEYGGLLNGFRVVGLGDFATRILAVGQKRGSVTVYRATGQVKDDKGVVLVDEARWGRTAQSRFYQDIIDQNDLNRRANQAAADAAKVGKRMALAIRVSGLSPFDGWDIGDCIRININRGMVDTSRYGSEYAVSGDGQGGWWRIIGVEYHVAPDAHPDMVLTVLPKQTAHQPNTDLLPSLPPAISPQWQVGYGVPGDRGDPPTATPKP